MRIAVVGAGVVGVTTAHELALDGHQVTVFERRGNVAAEASFANAGVIAPGYVTPWAAPGMPSQVLRYLLSRHTPVRINPRLSPAAIHWMWRWWCACRSGDYPANRLRMQRLATFSRERLHRLTRDLKLDHERSSGCLVLMRSARELALAQPGLASLIELATPYAILDPAQCRAVEPNLDADAPLHAGIHLPSAEVGNCREFTTMLRAEAQWIGVRFCFHTPVQRIAGGPQPALVHLYAPPDESNLLLRTANRSPARNAGTECGDFAKTQPMPMQAVDERFDAIAVCAALGADALLRPLGLKLPLLAVHGYSITAPLRHREGQPDPGPRSAVMDLAYKVAISRLGTRIRVAGGAEIGGRIPHHHPRAIETLYKMLHDWFPGSARLNQAQVWKGALPMLPDGPPVIGHSGTDGIWLNLGHGSSGWALACGSARVLADVLVGRKPAIDVDGLGIDRLRR